MDKVLKKEKRMEKVVITKEKFEAYVDVQESGVTNMLAVNYVSSLSGLTKSEIIDIMENYSDYKTKFLKGKKNEK